MGTPIQLDLRGLKCPLPALRTRQALRRLAPGGEVIVASTDPLASLDIPHAAKEDGHHLREQWREGEVFYFHLVRRGKD